jgi:hypothetical protein
MWRSVDGPVAILDNIIESESPSMHYERWQKRDRASGRRLKDLETDEWQSLAEALELICQGLWFTRAWILEEYNSAGEHTITLLRCRPESTGMSSSEADFMIFR